MSLTALVSNYATFNHWANQRMIEWLRALPVNLLTEKSPSSFPSLDLTAQHILRAEKFWRLFILQHDLSGFSWAVREGDPLSVLSDLLSVSEQIKTDFAGFEEAALSEVLHLNMRWAKNSLPRYEYIFHVINHSTFHRGQLVTIARTLGVTEGVPATDYNIFNTGR